MTFNQRQINQILTDVQSQISSNQMTQQLLINKSKFEIGKLQKFTRQRPKVSTKPQSRGEPAVCENVQNNIRFINQI